MRGASITYQSPWDKDSRQNGCRHVGSWGTAQRNWRKLQVQKRWGLLGEEMFETGLQVVGDEGVCSGEGTVEPVNKSSYRPAACEVQRRKALESQPRLHAPPQASKDLVGVY